MPSPRNLSRIDGGTGGKVPTCPKSIRITPKNLSTNLMRQAQYSLTPKRKRCPESPPPTQTPKTPRLNFEEKIHQLILTQPPQNPKGKLKSSKPRNPHPNLNLQEFVKIGNTLTLIKHTGVAISSRKSVKQKKKKPVKVILPLLQSKKIPQHPLAL